MSASGSGGLVQRRNVSKPTENGAPGKEDDPKSKDSDAEDADSKETRLTLMEEVLLLGLKDKEVRFLNDCWGSLTLYFLENKRLRCNLKSFVMMPCYCFPVGLHIILE